MGLLHSTSGRRTLTSCFSRQLFSGSFATSRLACSLLGTSHFFLSERYNVLERSSEEKRNAVRSCVLL
ncbi:hypothetical protein ALC57_18916 [Trachymyrmex cornetzi]|uniref:Uncharacterized protein n=1 Tax=Trachymyrmex cornetzi TaxID=471704 RepID=A0A195D7T6_9HYME|nr:hypothetical protein ALC57_18916 [Trachymyrmex cornetzi]